MFLYNVGTALYNLSTYRRMTEGPILIDLFFFPSVCTFGRFTGFRHLETSHGDNFFPEQEGILVIASRL